MKWETKPRYREGDTRIVKRFLIFPVSIHGETRWCETVYVKQRYEEGYDCNYWKWLEWIDPVSVVTIKSTLKNNIKKLTNNLINTIRIEAESKINE